MPSRRASGGKGSSPTAYSEVSNSTENNERRRQQIERQISSGSIRLRTGSTGHKPLKNEDVDLEDDPIEVWIMYDISVEPILNVNHQVLRVSIITVVVLVFGKASDRG